MINIPIEHQLICVTCGKVLDMRNLGQICSHGIGNGDDTYYCLPDENELDVEYSGSKKVGSSQFYSNGDNTPINLN